MIGIDLHKLNRRKKENISYKGRQFYTLTYDNLSEKIWIYVRNAIEQYLCIMCIFVCMIL